MSQTTIKKLVSTQELMKRVEKSAQAFDRELAEEGKQIARQSCPRSDNNKPGHVHLQDTIRVVENKKGGIDLIAGDATKVDVAPAVLVEFGTHKTPGHFFMTTAAFYIEKKRREQLAKQKNFYK
jgi:hypothetical protein